VGLDPICIFGGAFDPIHIGHLLIAEDVRVMRNLAGILFVPCNLPPTKEKTEAGPEDRLEMVRLGVKDNPFFEASDIEVKRRGVSYTVETLRDIRQSFDCEREVYLLMGMDQLSAIESWREPEEIVSMCRILAVRRPGFKDSEIPAELAGSVEILETRQLEISSTEIRKRLSLGESVRYMLTDAVLEYILLHGLYGASSES
jgi:nicotinate-nucleotide adenylyltransferase